jgi:arylsulfatase A-like enzyme
MGSLAPLLVSLVLGCSGEPPVRNLVLISLDTTRADHLPTYGYSRPTAPRLDALGAGGTVFTNAFAQETNTNPSHSSMFTGLYPHVHGSLDNRYRLSEDRVTLAEILSETGFRCGGFVSGYTMKSRSGLQQGFEMWDDELPRKSRRPGAQTLERALTWLNRLSPGEPFFLFLHLYDSHGPYAPPPEYRGRFRSSSPGPTLSIVPKYQAQRDEGGARITTLHPYVDLYDAAIRHMDDLVARLLDRIDLDRTVVFVVADHGETLGERYWSLDHGAQTFDEQIRIPLIVHAPGYPPGRVDEFVETVDLLPTALKLLGLSVPSRLSLNGQSLDGLMAGRPGPLRDHVFASARATGLRHADRGYRLDGSRRIHTIRSRGWKLIRYPGPRHNYDELYAVDQDPGERVNLAEQRSEERERLGGLLEQWLAGASAAKPPKLTPEQRERLRSLGYVAD